MKKRDPRPYVGIHKEVIFGCPEWAALSAQAKCLYLMLKGKRNPAKNGGRVKLSYRDIKKLKYTGLKRQATVSRAFQELLTGEWIKRPKDEEEGGGLFGRATFYEFTAKFDQFGMGR